MTEIPHICATCNRSGSREDGAVSCGAGVNDARLHGDLVGPENPIWAERKYGRGTILSLLAGGEMPEGTDCENLDPTDGLQCKIWEPREMPEHRLKLEAKHLPAVIARVAKAWMENPETIPRGTRIERSSYEMSDCLGVRERMPFSGNTVPILEAAARYVAPGWDVRVFATVGGMPPEVLMGRYDPRDVADAVIRGR